MIVLFQSDVCYGTSNFVVFSVIEVPMCVLLWCVCVSCLFQEYVLLVVIFVFRPCGVGVE